MVDLILDNTISKDIESIDLIYIHRNYTIDFNFINFIVCINHNISLAFYLYFSILISLRDLYYLFAQSQFFLSKIFLLSNNQSKYRANRFYNAAINLYLANFINTQNKLNFLCLCNILVFLLTSWVCDYFHILIYL